VALGEEVDRARPELFPVPTNATVAGPVAALLEMKSVALSAPALEGVKTTYLPGSNGEHRSLRTIRVWLEANEN
jgi:hypothetical protein